MSRQEIKERAWKQMEALLDNELPNKERKRYFLYFPAAAAITLILSLGALLSINNRTTPFTAEYEPMTIQTITENKLGKAFTVDKDKAIMTNRQAETSETKEIASNFREEVTTGLFVFEDRNQVSRMRTSTEIYFPNRIETREEEKVFVIKDDKLSKETEESKVDDTNRANSRNSSPQNSTMITNQPKQEQKVLFITPEIRKSFQPIQDMGLQSNGSLGLVSDNFEDYGLRMGFELKKPISKNLNANTGVRYSIYKEEYRSTYVNNTPEELQDHIMVSRLTERNVSRSFIEIPVYADYELTENLTLKGGASVTYNRNKSEAPAFSSVSVANNTSLTQETKQEIGKLYQDQNGYLGEYLVGASLNVEKLTFDLEATRGFINNQNIDNRNVVGMRISYQFGQ